MRLTDPDQPPLARTPNVLELNTPTILGSGSGLPALLCPCAISNVGNAAMSIGQHHSTRAGEGLPYPDTFAANLLTAHGHR